MVGGSIKMRLEDRGRRTEEAGARGRGREGGGVESRVPCGSDRGKDRGDAPAPSSRAGQGPRLRGCKTQRLGAGL